MRRIIFLLVATLFVCLQAVAQTTISGTVTDSKGEPVPGANVRAKGYADIGTVTDFNGKYSLSVPTEATTLVFSFVGMQSKEVEIGGQSIINASLEGEDVGIDEVVVTALGISKDRKAIGYASTSVSGEEIANSRVVNPMNALQGKVAGVDISSGPGAGSTQNVIIRGSSSFGSNQPLYVVDGVPIVNSQNRAGDNLNAQVDFGSGINALNPDDIEDMTVLKGAAATALYGSRAANGVVLITTKAGKNTNGKVHVNYDGSVSLQRIGRIPERQSDFGQGWSGYHALDENGNWGPRYDGKMRPWGNVVDNSQQVAPFSYLEDRVRDFYDLGMNYKNSLSLQGGNESTNYFFSVSNNNIDGVLPDDVDTYKRTTLSLKGSHKVDKLKLTSSINFSNEETNVVPSGQGNTAFRGVWEIAENISVLDLKDYNSKFNNLDNYFTPYGVNPYFLLNENGAKQKKSKFFGKFQADYNLTDGLVASYRFGGDLENTTAESWQAQILITDHDAPNYGTNSETAGSYQLVKRTRYEFNHYFHLNYAKDFSDVFSLNSLIGTNINQQGYDRATSEITALDVPGYYNLDNGTSDPISDQYTRKRRLIGVYANIDLEYNDYAYLTLTARNDWSSTLPEDNNSYFYPGATASLIFTELAEKGGVGLGPLSYGKLRASYGWTGKDAPPYVIDPVFVKGFSTNPGYPDIDNLAFPLNGINSWMMSSTLGSPDLAPEITKEFELGTELRFFENRLSIDFAYYNKLTEGLIENLPLDPSTGFLSQTKNIGDVRNKGIEAIISGTPIKAGDFTWNIAVNYTKNTNKVEKLAEGEIFLGGFGGMGIVAIKGEELGLFKTTIPQTVDINGEEHVIVDGNGMVVASADQEVIKDKSINEKFRFGLTNTFSWKGLSLSATFDYRHGGYMFSYTKDYMRWTGSDYQSTYNERRTFIVPNSVVDNGDGTYSENTTPVSSEQWHTFYSNGALQSDDHAIIDKSYLKLREVGLSYVLPNSLVSKLKLSNVRASFVVNNILIWTPAENSYIDPETTTFGNDVAAKFGEFGGGPTNQTYTFGLSVSF